jgi:hypothetical protein
LGLSLYTTSLPTHTVRAIAAAAAPGLLGMRLEGVAVELPAAAGLDGGWSMLRFLPVLEYLLCLGGLCGVDGCVYR